MKKYDFQKAKNFIEGNLPEIKDAALGMYEDWFWTGVEIFNESEGFVQDLDSIELIAGINSSSWATPCLRLNLTNGEDRCFACFVDDGAPRVGGNVFGLGVLSGPVQDRMPKLEEELIL